MAFVLRRNRGLNGMSRLCWGYACFTCSGVAKTLSYRLYLTNVQFRYNPGMCKVIIFLAIDTVDFLYVLSTKVFVIKTLTDALVKC